MEVMTPQHKTKVGRSTIERILSVGTAARYENSVITIESVTQHCVVILRGFENPSRENMTYLQALNHLGYAIDRDGWISVAKDGDFFLDVSSLHLMLRCSKVESKVHGNHIQIAKEENL